MRSMPPRTAVATAWSRRRPPYPGCRSPSLPERENGGVTTNPLRGNAGGLVVGCLVLAVISLVVRVAQHAAGQVAGVLALFHQHLAVDEGGVDAGRRFLEAPAARREVVDDEFRQRLYRIRIEDRDVGGHAGAQQPAVVEPEMRCRIEGQPPHRVFEAHDLLLAHPLAEEAGREAVAAVELHMRAAIG